MQTEKPSFYKRLSSYLHEKMKCKQTKKKIIIHQKQNWSERWIIWTTQMHSKNYTSPFQTFMYSFLLCSNTVSYIFYHNIFPTQNNKGIFIGLAAEWSLKIGLLLIYFFFLHLLSKNVISFFKGFSY